MVRFVAVLLLASAAAAASGQAMNADPLSSSECAAARSELDKALSEPAAGQARSQRLARARQQVALVCLGPGSGERVRSGAPQPAQAVPPSLIPMPPAPAPAPAITPPPPPPDVPRAAPLTTCDPAGCWDSEGRRLNKMGPLLISPRGLCTIEGGLLNCP